MDDLEQLRKGFGLRAPAAILGRQCLKETVQRICMIEGNDFDLVIAAEAIIEQLIVEELSELDQRIARMQLAMGDGDYADQLGDRRDDLLDDSTFPDWSNSKLRRRENAILGTIAIRLLERANAETVLAISRRYKDLADTLRSWETYFEWHRRRMFLGNHEDPLNDSLLQRYAYELLFSFGCFEQELRNLYGMSSTDWPLLDATTRAQVIKVVNQIFAIPVADSASLSTMQDLLGFASSVIPVNTLRAREKAFRKLVASRESGIVLHRHWQAWLLSCSCPPPSEQEGKSLTWRDSCNVHNVVASIEAFNRLTSNAQHAAWQFEIEHTDFI